MSLSVRWDPSGTTHGRVKTQREKANFWQNFPRLDSESAKYLVQLSSLLIILLLVDNDRFDRYLYNGNSSNQEGKSRREDELHLCGTH